MRQLAEYPSVNGPTWLTEFKDLDEELRFLRSLITRFRGVPLIRDLAMTIVRDAGAPSRDKRAQALAIGRWCHNNIYYVHELPERFQWPDETLRTKSGDCDDFTSLECSLLESIGIPSLMVVMCVNGAWSHIFAAAKFPEGLLPLDASARNGIDLNPIAYANAAGKHVMIKLA